MPRISLGVPFGLELISWDTNDLITPFIAAVLGPCAQRRRPTWPDHAFGHQSVDAGQHDAARALGFTPGARSWRIVFPQAMRTVLPPAGSQVIRHAQGHLAGQRHRDDDLLFSAADHLQPQLQVVPSAAGGGWYSPVSVHRADAAAAPAGEPLAVQRAPPAKEVEVGTQP